MDFIAFVDSKKKKNILNTHNYYTTLINYFVILFWYRRFDSFGALDIRTTVRYVIRSFGKYRARYREPSASDVQILEREFLSPSNDHDVSKAKRNGSRPRIQARDPLRTPFTEREMIYRRFRIKSNGV